MATQPPKISATDPVKFRPGEVGPLLVELMDALRIRQPDVELSATLRDALMAFWPQISAYLKARQQTRLASPELTELVIACARAHEFHVTPSELQNAIMELIERKVTAPGQLQNAG